MLEENLKRLFTIIHGKFAESLLSKLVWDSKYEAINHDQDVIVMLKLIKGVMFKFNGIKELTDAIWEAYLSVFRCRQHKFETNEDYFERFNNSMSVITQYDGSVGQDTGLLNHLGSKKDAQEKFLAVGLVQNSDKVRYADLKIYMHDSYINVNYS